MSEQICDICKKEPVRIHIKGQGNFCLKCYNTMILERIGVDDTFHYPDTMAVREPNGSLHTFHIEHMIMGDTVCWDAFEQNGIYHFREISDIGSNGTESAQRFFRKIVEGVCTKSLCESEQRADNLLHRDGKYISLRDKGEKQDVPVQRTVLLLFPGLFDESRAPADGRTYRSSE